MWFCPERAQTIEHRSKLQPKGSPDTVFLLGGPNPFNYTQELAAVTGDKDPYEISRVIIRHCLRSVSPAPEGWALVDDRYPLSCIREISTELINELAGVCLDTFIRPSEELEKNLP